MLKQFISNTFDAIQEAYDAVTQVDEHNPNEHTEYPTDAELAEAFRELAALRKQNRDLRDTVTKMNDWTADAKEAAGYDTNTSFDDVFNDLLAFYLKNKDKYGH